MTGTREKNPYRLPFDQYQRYRLAMEVITVLEGEEKDLSVLEAGASSSALELFLPGRRFTFLDREPWPEARFVRGDALCLPFPDKSFEVVVSLDTLEHLPREKRRDFIHELCRCSRRHVVLAAPFASEQVKAADRAVFDFIKGISGWEHPFLKEHLELELPNLAETVALLSDQGFEVQVIPSGRLDRWLFMMAAYYLLDRDPDLRPALDSVMEAYNRAFYDFDKAEPAYRHFLAASREKLGEKWHLLAELATGEPADKLDPSGFAMMMGLAGALGLREKDKENLALKEQLKEKDHEMQHLRTYAKELEEFVEQVKALPLYSLYEKFLKPFFKK